MAVEQGGNGIKENISYSHIELIYFDAGDVLYRLSGGLQLLSQKVGLSFEDCNNILSGVDDSICRGETDPQELWKRIKAAANYKGDGIDVVSFWVDHFEPIPEVHRLVRDLSKDRGVGLLTNIYPGAFQLAIEKGKIPDIPYVSVIQSCEVHLVKPDLDIYELAEIRGNPKPEAILFIDNNPQFLLPAELRGWSTFLIEPEKIDQNVKSLRTNFGI
jgi:FMN phosphatase YigB (HAD superfamily)